MLTVNEQEEDVLEAYTDYASDKGIRKSVSGLAAVLH